MNEKPSTTIAVHGARSIEKAMPTVKSPPTTEVLPKAKRRTFSAANNRGAVASQVTGDTTLNYQGHLLDSAGQPIDTTVLITFRLYNSYTNGTLLWAELHSMVPVQDGLFNVTLGSITAIPTTFLSRNTDLWLSVQIDSDSEMSPRERLTEVPLSTLSLTVPDSSISTDKLEDGAVMQVKLGSDVGLEPPDGSITTDKLANGAVTQLKAPELVRSVVRLDDDSSVLDQTNQNIAKGWGCWDPTDGNTSIYIEPIAFPFTYEDTPIIVVSLAGDAAQVSPPTTHGDFQLIWVIGRAVPRFSKVLQGLQHLSRLTLPIQQAIWSVSHGWQLAH